MTEPRKIRVMVSSRSMTTVKFAGESPARLEDLRRELKDRLEAGSLFEKLVFQVWIHEDATADDASRDAWEESLAQIRQADIVLVLYNGEAGWTIANGTQGICHDELAEAIKRAPAKVRVVRLDPLAPMPKAAAAKKREQRFRDYVERQARWRTLAKSREQLLEMAEHSVRAALDQLFHMGSGAAATGSDAYGTSLDWDLLDLSERRRSMITELRRALEARDGKPHGDHGIVVTAGHPGRRVYFRCDAVPAAMTVPAAREMVGQPFLAVRELCAKMKAAKADAGPIHLIACHKGATETQAMRLLGYPDATIIAAPFGVYVADDVQKIQLVFLAGCRNPSAVHHGVQRMFVWLDQAAEEARLVGRAESRRRIIEAIAKEKPDNR